MSYYKKELETLKNSEYFKTVILSDGIGNKTRNLNLNAESIPEVIEFLKKELKRLKKGGT